MQTLTRIPGAPDGAPILVFVHANGYPPESYRLMLSSLAREYRIYTLEHRPFWSEEPAPWRLDWRVYAEDLLKTLTREIHEPFWLAGHSMGAIVSMKVALKVPDKVLGLIALDPVLVPFKFWLPVQVLVRLLRRDIPIAQVALKRPHDFQGFEAAFAFYRSKRPFRRIGDEALWDYVNAAHRPVPGHGVTLRWTGAWEACVYRSVPYMLSALKRLRMPVLGVAGKESDVLREATLARWAQAMPELKLAVLPAGHLVPIEQPEACAELIHQFICDNAVSQ